MVRDVRRDRKKAELWRRRLAAQARGGVSIRAWCRRNGVPESAFYWWRTQLARRDPAAPPPLAPVHIVADAVPEAAGRIEIVLSGERCVHVIGRVARGTLIEVLAALGTSSGAEASGC